MTAGLGDLDELAARARVGAARSADALPPRVRAAAGVAASVGAPLLPALDAIRSAMDDDAEAERAIRVAAAQARTVAAGLLGLPLLLVPGLGRLLELDLLGFYSTGAGRVVGVVALVLLATGVAATRTLVARTARAPSRRGPGAVVLAPVVGALLHPALALAGGLLAVVVWRRRARQATPPDDAAEVVELVAVAATGATSVGGALRAAVPHTPRHADVLSRLALALELGRPIDLPPPFDRLHDVLSRTTVWGAPAAPSLRRLAADLRAERRTVALERAERLPALLTFPTALCLLPATVLLVGAPLVAAGLDAAGVGRP